MLFRTIEQIAERAERIEKYPHNLTFAVNVKGQTYYVFCTADEVEGVVKRLDAKSHLTLLFKSIEHWGESLHRDNFFLQTWGAEYIWRIELEAEDLDNGEDPYKGIDFKKLALAAEKRGKAKIRKVCKELMEKSLKPNCEGRA